MEPQSNSLDQAPKIPEALSTPEVRRKLENVPIGALENLGDNESHELIADATNGSPQAVATEASAIAQSVAQSPSQDKSLANSPTIQAPITATDDDVIEKEWVKKSKKVVAQTKGDPYAKEMEVSKLQVDYVQKRYGKQIKIPDEL